MRNAKEKSQGQALVEYLIMLTVAISLVAALGSSFRGALLNLWAFYIQTVTAGCPTGCPPTNSNYRF